VCSKNTSLLVTMCYEAWWGKRPKLKTLRTEFDGFTHKERNLLFDSMLEARWRQETPSGRAFARHIPLTDC